MTVEQRTELRRKEARIFSTEPDRPNGAPRQDNVTDEEVREIQQAAVAIYPDAIVNISTITAGCECEEAGVCTAQVWLVLYRPERIRGLMLSRIGGHWQIGAVQDWWLRYYDLRSRMPRVADRAADPLKWREKLQAWQLEEQELVNGFPSCKVPAEKRN